MEKIKLDHWFVDEDGLAISLNDMYCTITFEHTDYLKYYTLGVKDQFNNNYQFGFYSLEDAVSFTEDTVSYCRSGEEAVQEYYEQFAEGKFKVINYTDLNNIVQKKKSKGHK